MASRHRIAALIGLASYLALCTGSALALHIWAEGSEHEYEPDDCPVCNQLTYGSVAQADDGPVVICTPEANPLGAPAGLEQQFRLRFTELECLGPRAPPLS
jgi:hypothetical protein